MNRWFRPVQMLHLVAGHFKEVRRQPAVLFWGIIFPMLISLGLGLAFTQQGEVAHQAAVMPDVMAGGIPDTKDIGSRGLLKRHASLIEPSEEGHPRYQLSVEDEKIGHTRFVFVETTWPRALQLLKRGSISVIIKKAEQELDYHFDPMNAEAQLTFLKLSKILSGAGAPDQTIGRHAAPLTVKGSRYIDFLVPGLISMGIMMSCMWGIGYGLIEKRSKKMLRRMVATPMRKSHFLMALMAVRIVMNMIEALLLFLFAVLVFDITIQGSLPALFVIFIAGNIAFGGIAILTASHTANTEVGNGLINAVVLPMSVLSGVFFSYQNFPGWSQSLIEKLPLTLLADGTRSIFIEGAGFSETIGSAILLLGIGVFFFAAGLRVFKWH